MSVLTEEEAQKIVRPLVTPVYTVALLWRNLKNSLESFGQDYGGLVMEPDFQRGHVWTPEQQRHFIENALRGVISQAGLTIQFNCPDFDYRGNLKKDVENSFVCMDGLQRITAVMKYIDGEIKPFGYSIHDFENTSFRLSGSNLRFQLCVYNMQTRAEILQHYIDINAGSTPHTKDEIDRVRNLLKVAPEPEVMHDQPEF